MISQEFRLQYESSVEKEWLPEPKFEGIYWQGMPNEKEVEGQFVTLNGVAWALDHVGFQGSDGIARVKLHPEPTQQEDVFFLQGNGEMIIWNGLECSRGRSRKAELKGVLSRAEIEAATFVLTVASWHIPALHNEIVDHLVLNVEVNGRHEAVEPTSTPTRYHHGYDLTEASHYLVVKRRQI